MINSRNLEDILQQSTRPVSTTSKSILASAITLPNGSVLSTYTTPQTELDNKRVNLIALFVYQQLLAFRMEAANGNSYRSDSNRSLTGLSTANNSINEDIHHVNVEGLLKFDKVDDEEIEIYVQDIVNTEFKIVLISEKGYPDGIIKLKVDELLKNLKELEKFEYIED